MDKCSTYLGQKGFSIYKDSLTIKEQQYIRDALNVRPYIPKAPIQPNPFPIYRESSGKLYVPRYFGIENYGNPDEIRICDGKLINLSFHGELKSFQKDVVDTYLKKIKIAKNYGGGGLLDIPCGHGKTVLAVVPARGGSKGLRKKNLIEIGGLSLIAHAAKTVSSLPWIDHAVISSDEQEMMNEGIRYGLSAPFKRPLNLAGDYVDSIDVWQHAFEESEKHWKINFDITILLEPTSPYRNSDDVKAAVRKLADEEYDSVLTVSETDSKAHPLKQLVFDGGNITHYDPKADAIVARQQLCQVYHRNGVAYVMTKDCLMNIGKIMNKNTTAIVVDRPVVNIDTESDVRFAEYLFARPFS